MEYLSERLCYNPKLLITESTKRFIQGNLHIPLEDEKTEQESSKRLFRPFSVEFDQSEEDME